MLSRLGRVVMLATICSGYPYDVQVTDIKATSALFRWKSTEIFVEEFVVHCAGSQRYIKDGEVKHTEMHFRTQHVPKGLKNVVIGDLRPNSNYTCMIGEKLEHDAQTINGLVSKPIVFSSDYSAPVVPETPTILKKDGIIHINIYKPSSMKFGPITGYVVQFHVMEDYFLSTIPIIDRELTDPFGKFSPVSLEYAQVSSQPLSFQILYGNDTPSFIQIGDDLLNGALKSGIVYSVVTVAYTKCRDTTIAFTPSVPSDSFVAVGVYKKQKLFHVDEAKAQRIKIAIVAGIVLPLICLLYMCFIGVLLLCRERYLTKEYHREDESFYRKTSECLKSNCLTSWLACKTCCCTICEQFEKICRDRDSIYYDALDVLPSGREVYFDAPEIHSPNIASRTYYGHKAPLSPNAPYTSACENVPHANITYQDSSREPGQPQNTSRGPNKHAHRDFESHQRMGFPPPKIHHHRNQEPSRKYSSRSRSKLRTGQDNSVHRYLKHKGNQGKSTHESKSHYRLHGSQQKPSGIQKSQIPHCLQRAYSRGHTIKSLYGGSRSQRPKYKNLKDSSSRVRRHQHPALQKDHTPYDNRDQSSPLHPYQHKVHQSHPTVDPFQGVHISPTPSNLSCGDKHPRYSTHQLSPNYHSASPPEFNYKITRPSKEGAKMSLNADIIQSPRSPRTPRFERTSGAQTLHYTTSATGPFNTAEEFQDSDGHALDKRHTLPATINTRSSESMFIPLASPPRSSSRSKKPSNSEMFELINLSSSCSMSQLGGISDSATIMEVLH